MSRPNYIPVLITIVALCTACRAYALPHAWSKSFGEEATQYLPYVAADDLGNVFVAGTFSGTINLGGLGFWSVGLTDIFLAKFDPAGNHVWSRACGGVLTDWVHGVAVDASGNVIITGQFEDTAYFGGEPLASAGWTDIFLAKYDPYGNHLWSLRFGDGSPQRGNGVAVDAAGNILLTGRFRGTVDFGGGPLSTLINDYNVFVAKLDPNGNHIWSQGFGDLIDYQTARRITVDGAGNVIVLGDYENTIDFGGGPLPTTLPGLSDKFLVQFDPSGTYNWSRAFTATTTETCHDVAVDHLDGVIITGSFQGTLDLGGGPLAAGDMDIFLARYDQGGNHLWSRSFGEVNAQDARSVVADGAGTVTITGEFQDSVDFGGGLLLSAGSHDVYLAQFDLYGNHIWSQSFGDPEDQSGLDLATYEEDNLFVTGEFQGSVNFGGGTLTCGGYEDIFLAKFCRPVLGLSHYDYAFDVPYILAKVEVENIGPGPVEAVTARMSEDISWLQITDAYCYYGDIPEGESSWGVDDDSYKLVLLPEYPGGSFDVWFDVDYYDEAGNYYHTVHDYTLPDPRVTDVNEPANVAPAAFRLLPNYPNPFNPLTKIEYQVPESAPVRLGIYDAHGRCLAMLVDELRDAGWYEAVWRGTDRAGRRVSSGLYFYRLETGGYSETRKMLLLQ